MLHHLIRTCILDFVRARRSGRGEMVSGVVLRGNNYWQSIVVYIPPLVSDPEPSRQTLTVSFARCSLILLSSHQLQLPIGDSQLKLRSSNANA